MKIAHLINLFEGNSIQMQAQSATIASMQAANDVAEFCEMDIRLNACVFGNDFVTTPYNFRDWELMRSTYDLPGEMRKLPFIHEIFQCFKEISYVYSPDVFVYSNADILLSSHFYTSLPFVLKNRDAATILRTTIGKGLIQNHPGYDCFVFRKELLSKIKLPKNVFLGYPPVGNCVFDALRAAALPHNFNIIPSEWRLTFHIGDDKLWKDHPYVKINQEYAYKNIEAL